MKHVGKKSPIGCEHCAVVTNSAIGQRQVAAYRGEKSPIGRTHYCTLVMSSPIGCAYSACSKVCAPSIHTLVVIVYWLSNGVNYVSHSFYCILSH